MLASTLTNTLVRSYSYIAYIFISPVFSLDLSYRDDLESLLYTMIFLYKGNLPWSYFSDYGTYLGCIKQVHKQKKRYNGQQLTSEVPLLVMLFDYARSLPKKVIPDYAAWRSQLERYVWREVPIVPWRAQKLVTGEMQSIH